MKRIISAWWPASVLFLTSAALTFSEGTIAIVLPPLLDSRGIGPRLIGFLISMYGVAALSSRYPSGQVYSPERAIALVFFGAFATAPAFFVVPATTNLVWISAVLVLQGLGFGVATTVIMAMLPDYAPETTTSGTLMAWLSGFIGAGYSLAGFIGGWAASSSGIAATLRILGFAPIVGACAALLLVRARLRRPDVLEVTPKRVDEQGDVDLVSQEGPTDSGGGISLRVPAIAAATLVAFYLNVNYGAVNSFFPIHALGIGLTLANVGRLIGVHSGLAAAVRFFSAFVFRKFSYVSVVRVTLAAAGIAIVLMARSETMPFLLVAWGLLGLSRGLLRVASGALVLQASKQQEHRSGQNASTYLSGLDAGRIVGPLAAGAVLTFVTIPSMLLMTAVLAPITLVAVVRLIGRIPPDQTAEAP